MATRELSLLRSNAGLPAALAAAVRVAGLLAAVLCSAMGLSAEVRAQAPPGFKTYENKLSELTFCYSSFYKEVPLPPTEQLLVAKFVLKRTPRELKKVSERIVKAVNPQLLVFAFDDASGPVTGGGASKGGGRKGGKAAGGGAATVRELMEGRSRVTSWEQFSKRLGWQLEARKTRVAGLELFAFAPRPVGRGMTATGYLARRRIGSRVIGAYAWSLDPFDKKLRKIVEQMGKSLAVATSDANSDLVERRIDRIYRKSQLAGIDWRKKVRRGLARGWKAVDTDNYLIVHHSKNGSLIRRIARDVEAMRTFYMKLFPPTGKVDRVCVLRLCATKQEYHQYGGPPNTGGYWHPGNEELVLFDYSYTQRTLSEAEKKRMGGRRMTSEDSMLVMRHEAFHQYIFYAIGEFSPHDWFNEGYGDYFSGAVIHPNTGRVRKMAPSSWRIDHAKRMCGEGKGFLPLRKILSAERAQFYNRSRIGDYYAGAWSFVYFLQQSEVATKHPQWSQLLTIYFDAVKQGYAAEIADVEGAPNLKHKQVAGFTARRRALETMLEGLDVEELEKAWRQYVADL
ncbi:MAG: DUF1570 domain-containing protein [Planctomycetota bacterium]